MQRIILCDIDGTLANVVHRIHLVTGKEKNWEEFNSLCQSDRVKENIANILRQFVGDYETTIVIVTARENKWRKETEKWLHLNDIPYDDLHMRPIGDKRSDAIIKEEILLKNYDKESVWFVLEDRSKVVKMWRKLGLTCLQVAEGDF